VSKTAVSPDLPDMRFIFQITAQGWIVRRVTSDMLHVCSPLFPSVMNSCSCRRSARRTGRTSRRFFLLSFAGLDIAVLAVNR